MKIRRLELFGFKSFKDKTILSFDQPITAIVGSNGCGKSNVIDALYWVMGDMSPKHLRGHVMADVIFSGSRDSAPLDLAEVTLVLERDPAVDPELPPQFQSSNEIQITRRYYRSGESEYFINKVPCRLRDIQEFFMDTGVGAKAYSIIEQGAISRLVTQKPEERRVVIEEVAGIMKFKARKAETERKLENSRVNLTRIDDIVKDLQKQLSSLKRQAEKAEKFRSYSTELKNLEIQMGSKEWLQRSEAKEKALLLSGELAQAREERETALATARERLETLGAELSTMETDLSAKRSASRDAELSLKDLETKIATFETRREGLEHRLNDDRDALVKLDARKEELEQLLAQLDGELSTAEGAVVEAQNRGQQASDELAALRERTEGVRETVETSRRQLHQEEIEQTRLTQEIQNHQRSLGQLQNRSESLETQIQGLGQELSLRQSEHQGTLNHLNAAFSTRSDLETEKTAVDERLSALETERTGLQTERDQVRESLTVARIRKEQLEALDRDLDGVDAAGRALARALRQEGRTETMLADTVKVPALLEKAVEALFGKHLQRIVGRDLGDISSFRKILSESDDPDARQSRSSVWMPEVTREHSSALTGVDLNSAYMPAMAAAAGTEMPMGETQISEVPGPDGLVSQTIVQKVPTVREFLVNHPGVVGPLNELVREEGQEPPLWLNLTNDVWIVRDGETLSELAPQLAGLPVTFVTLDGDVLTKEGFLDMAPAAAAEGVQNVGLVQRRREIQELKARESELEGHLAMAQGRFDSCLASISTEKEKFRELTARLAALNPDVERHSSLLRQVEAQLARLSEKEVLLKGELERAEQDKVELSRRIDEVTAKLAETETRRNSTEESFETAKAELQTSLGLQRESESRFQQIQSEQRKLDEQLSELRQKRAASEQEKTLSAARRQHLETGIATLDGEIQNLRTELEQRSEERSIMDAALMQAREAEAGAAGEVDTLKTRVQETQKSADRLAQELQQVFDRMHDIDQELAVNDVEIRNLRERLQAQYQLSLDELTPEKLQELATPSDLEILADAEAAKKHAQTLRTRIENLGKINMVAVEEFEDVSKRHEYLYIQRQDLADAIQQLMDAIDRIDKESRHRFAEAFAAVNDAFQKTFPVLFGGGQAELRLTNPDNLLESGVEIVAQPPGKKLQSVTLLSGGEKALTAVSLIFGIFSIKPSPFCVLDEVDAPLDDSNVARFNSQVRNMSQTSQIIMITHHKKSMESCDAMFGVTMERPGISKVASAKLGELRGG